MSAPLSIGELDGCVVACPLHEGRFDLCDRRDGPDADDRRPRPRRRLPPDLVARPAGTPKVDPPGKKAEARRLTRVRRLRYYPVRVVDGRIEVALPTAPPEAG